MREIKFRVWDKNKGEMITSAVEFELRRLEETTKPNEYSDTIGYVPSDYHRFDIMQYTGLKDKNGVEVFEGDVIDFSDNDDFNCYAEVCMAKSNLGWAKKYDDGCAALMDDRDLRSWCVVGNIYENPDLMNEL